MQVFCYLPSLPKRLAGCCPGFAERPDWLEAVPKLLPLAEGQPLGVKCRGIVLSLVLCLI
jgi:hypothetical protein